MFAKLSKYFLLACGIVVGSTSSNALWAQQNWDTAPRNWANTPHAQRESGPESRSEIATSERPRQRQNLREQPHYERVDPPRQRYTGAPRTITQETNYGYYDAVDDDYEGVGFDYGQNQSYSGNWQPQRWYHTGYYGRSFGNWFYDSIDSEYDQFND